MAVAIAYESSTGSVGIWIELNNVAQMAVDGFLPHPFPQEAFSHAVDQFGAIFSLLFKFRVGSFGA